MKWLLLAGLLIFVSACVVSPEDSYAPSGIKDSKQSGSLGIHLFVNPDPDKRNLSIDDEINVGVYFENRGTTAIAGIVSLEDTPADEQFGGIYGKAVSSFSVPAALGNKPGSMSVFPEPSISYQDSQANLQSTSFISEVRYQREIEFTSDDFWLRRIIGQTPEGCKKNCGASNTVASNSPVVSSIREELFAYGSEHQLTNIVDSMQLDFDVSEGACELIPMEKAENFDAIEKDEKVLSMDISLQQSGISLECKEKETKDQKRKTIICVIDHMLSDGDYTERITGTIKYGCRLFLRSGEIKFGSKGG